MINVTLLNESGFHEAMLGLSLSYGIDISKAYSVALKLYPKDGGHNKFLESMYMWLDITAPRYWWQEADTYRVGCSKQSQSTMHTLVRDLKDGHIYWQKHFTIEPCEEVKKLLLRYAAADDIASVKAVLPEGFMQRRIWCLNYKTLRNILMQRSEHRLKEWKVFCKEVLLNAAYPEFLE